MQGLGDGMHPDLMPAGETSEDCDGEKYKRFGFHPPAFARGLPADRVKAYVELVGEQPDEADLKKILRTTVRKLYEKGRKKMEKPDFSKFIEEELEGEEEKAEKKGEGAK
jgi:hypothetical protein